jgi:HAD superfamily hydrolase (TIGR01458 family)
MLFKEAHGMGQIKLVMLDLDGTTYQRGKLIPGAIDTIENLKVNGFRKVFLTNTDSVPPSSVVSRLNRLGIPVEAHEVFSPPVAVANFLTRNRMEMSFFLVSETLKPYFAKFPQSDSDPKWVVVGDLAQKVNYQDLNQAFRCLHQGADLIAMNKGRWIDRSDGVHLDTGPFVALLEFASRKTARIMGKPSVDYMTEVMDLCNVSPQECVMIGDDVEIDIRGAHEIGASSILVRTGAYNQQILNDSPWKPDRIIDSIAELTHVLANWS